MDRQKANSDIFISSRNELLIEFLKWVFKWAGNKFMTEGTFLFLFLEKSIKDCAILSWNRGGRAKRNHSQTSLACCYKKLRLFQFSTRLTQVNDVLPAHLF